MRSKAPLALMEQAVMVLVFALAAVLCLRVFVRSDIDSKNGTARDRAAEAAQSAAEVLKHEGGPDQESADILGGEYEDGIITVNYDGDWERTEDNPRYILTAVKKDSGEELLGLADIQVKESDGKILFELSVGWQKGAGR